MLYEIFTNKVLIIPICAWAIAQSLKVILVLARGKRLDLRYLVSSGGMPSAHSATVSALATAVAMLQGLATPAFGIAAIFAMVVMYDAAGLRQSVSKQSAALNHIIRELKLGHAVSEMRLRELIGHTPFQVIVGSALGILIAWLWLTIAAL